jgi:hypothetical protein
MQHYPSFIACERHGKQSRETEGEREREREKDVFLRNEDKK